MAEVVRLDPALAETHPRHPERGGEPSRMSTQPIAAYSFLPWARQGLGTYIREGDQDATVTIRGSIDVSLQITGERDRRRHGHRTAAAARVQLYGPGDIIGIDAQGHRPHRAAPLDHQLRDQLPARSSSSTTRTSPGATRRPSPRRTGGGCGRGWRWSCSRRASSTSEGTGGLGRPLPFIEVADAGAEVPAGRSAVGVGARPRQRRAGRRPQRHGGARGAARRRPCRPTATSPIRACSARASSSRTPRYHAFLIPTLRDRPAGRARQGSGRGAVRDAERLGGLCRPRGCDALPLLPPLVLPHRRRVGDFEYLVRLLQPRTVDSAGRPARHGRAGAGREPARRFPSSAAFCGSAARCARRSRR